MASIREHTVSSSTTQERPVEVEEYPCQYFEEVIGKDGKIRYRCKFTEDCQSCITRKEMLRHINTHTRERTFNCKLCGKVFTQSCNLKVHEEAVHVKVKDRVCPYRYIDGTGNIFPCTKRYSNSTAFIKHKSLKHGFHASDGGATGMDPTPLGMKFPESTYAKYYYKTKKGQAKGTRPQQQTGDAPGHNVARTRRGSRTAQPSSSAPYAIPPASVSRSSRASTSQSAGRQDVRGPSSSQLHPAAVGDWPYLGPIATENVPSDVSFQQDDVFAFAENVQDGFQFHVPDHPQHPEQGPAGPHSGQIAPLAPRVDYGVPQPMLPAFYETIHPSVLTLGAPVPVGANTFGQDILNTGVETFPDLGNGPTSLPWRNSLSWPQLTPSSDFSADPSQWVPGPSVETFGTYGQ